jgi:hypothetical protein
MQQNHLSDSLHAYCFVIKDCHYYVTKSFKNHFQNHLYVKVTNYSLIVLLYVKLVNKMFMSADHQRLITRLLFCYMSS